MKKLERQEMKKLKGGLFDAPPGSTCTYVMTGTNGPGFCDYSMDCVGGYGGPRHQDWCDATCFSDCNTMGCTHISTWVPVP